MATSDNASVDRLSALPEAVCTRILSLLPTKDAVATGQLSRRWRRRWCRLPSIDLDFGEFSAGQVPSWQSQSSYTTFVDLVLPICASRRSLRRVALRPCSGTWQIEIDRWVRLAMAGRQLVALELDFSHLLTPHHLGKHLSGEAPLRVPDSLEELKLKCCVFDPLGFEPFRGLADAEFLSRFPALESLVIFHCEVKNGLAVRHCRLRWVEMEGISFEPPAAGCPLEVEAPAMEELSLREMKGSPALVVRMGGQLQRLKVENCYFAQGEGGGREDTVGISLEVDAPALCEFRFYGEPGKDGMLASTLFSCLRALTMEVGLVYEELPTMEALLRSSPFLQSLSINIDNFGEPFVRDLSNVDYEVERLEELYGDYWESFKGPIHCLALHLRTIEIKNFTGKRLEDELARFLAANGKVLTKMAVSTPSAIFSGLDFL
ncbi:unnamed protein product [Spirodela intermedia]|uniref:Uncharacterized protein n=1 Tax=Spirodela intermedia TaxID=51605 RepID=A0A7I8IVY7_SPIIN|nr:unnamed protein product [Spirodela intermedia]CAA6662156.1 unnamed protein product [Spirodela intermedia]